MFVELKRFPGYSVSIHGEVKNMRTGRILKPCDCRGYLLVGPCVQKKRVPVKVHILVAEAFLGPRPEGAQVNHKDGNKTNNSVSNLEYLTPQENVDHAKALGLLKLGARHPSAKLTDYEVASIRAYKGTRTQQSVANEFGITQAHVSTLWANKQRAIT